MYQKYFGLREEPFSIAVNPHYLYMSERHREALAHLLYGVSEDGGIILLTGEVGTGKTTITRCLLKQLPDTSDVALILNPALSAEELLTAVCEEFSIRKAPGEQSLKHLSDALHQYLLNNHVEGRNTILLIDEAQHLRPEVLEQVRLLTNLETETRKLLKIILVGQPELRTILAQPELRQVSQRITAKYTLKALDLEETGAYIRHRLMVAGLTGNAELFPLGVVKSIHRASRGVPRLINILCDRMLLGTYGRNMPRVDRVMARQAIREIIQEEEQSPEERKKRLVIIGAVATLILLPGLLVWWWAQSPVTDPLLPPPEPSITAEQNTSTLALQEKSPAPIQEAVTEQFWFETQSQALDALLGGFELSKNRKHVALRGNRRPGFEV